MTNLTEETLEMFSNLLSSDQFLADETFDSILFDEDSFMNRTIIEVMKVFKENIAMQCECLTLLSFRCSQTTEKHFSTRAQTTQELSELISEILQQLNSVHALIRMEVLIALEEIFHYSSKNSDLVDALVERNLPLVFENEELCESVLERLEDFSHEPNTLVAQRADECYKRIKSGITSALGYLKAKKGQEEIEEMEQLEKELQKK